MSTRPRASRNRAVDAEGLVRLFGEVRAVDGVDLHIAEGEVYGFLGPNGAGKSTTVRMLCTLLAPTDGTARVGGFDAVRQSDQVRLRIGLALQEAALDPKLTGHELLALQGRYYGLRRDEIADRIAHLQGLVDIGDALDRLIGTYSGGMKRRLDLAASLMHNPDILFLDEPTTGLDPVTRVRVWEEIRGLNTELGMTIFLTTQYLDEADSLADRVGIINHGRIVAEGTPDALKRSIGADVVIARIDGDQQAARDAVRRVADVERVEVHGGELSIAVTEGATALSPIAVALDACGVKVRELTLRTPTLDDVFLEVTGGRILDERSDEPEPADEVLTTSQIPLDDRQVVSR